MNIIEIVATGENADGIIASFLDKQEIKRQQQLAIEYDQDVMDVIISRTTANPLDFWNILVMVLMVVAMKKCWTQRQEQAQAQARETADVQHNDNGDDDEVSVDEDEDNKKDQ